MLTDWLELQVQPIAVALLVSIGFFLMVFVTATLFGKKVHRYRHHPEYQTKWTLYLFHCLSAVAIVLVAISTIEGHWGSEDVGFGFTISWSIFALMVSGALSSQPWRYLRWVVSPENFPQPIWLLSLATGAAIVTSSVLFLDGRLSLIEPQRGEIVVSLVSKEISKDALGRSLLSDTITIEIEPYFDDVTVGSTVPFAVTVANGTERTIKGLTLSPVSAKSVGFEDNVSWEWERLEPRNTWGPKITSALFTAPGNQTVEFELSYTDDPTSDVIKAVGFWSGNVGAPKLHVERRMFVPETLKTGETIEVSLVVRNVGNSTATVVSYEPNLGAFFEIIEWSELPSTIPEGESARRFLIARAVESGDFTVLPPNITFSDSYGTDYENYPGYEVGYTDLSCDSGEECSPLERIRIHPSDVLTSSASYVALPPVISYDPGTITVQLAPGDNQTATLNISHDSDRELRVISATSDSMDPVELGVSEITVIPTGGSNKIPISIHAPTGTPYGHYQAILHLEVIDSMRPAGNQIYGIPITVDVAPVLIRHDLTLSHLAVGQQSMINTVITNVRNQRATVQIDIYFPDGGISVVSSQLEPVGTVRGTTGQVYSQVLELDPEKVKSHQRTVVVQIADDTPATKRIVGVIRYQFDDGLSGSLTSETYIHVTNP
jgi:hypothetical protein